MTNAVTACLDDHVAAGQGDRPALATPTQSVTYAELFSLACRAGNALRALGVEPEQRVALLLPDSPPFAAMFLGAMRIGAVPVPLNTRLRAADYEAILADSRAKVLVADGALAEPLRERLSALRHLRAVVVQGAASGAPAVEELLAAASPELAAEPVSTDDMAYWLYTSGTTGLPKAVVHLHRAPLLCQRFGRDVIGMRPEDRVLATSRLFFSYALGNAFLVPLQLGACVYLNPQWPEPASVAGAIKSFGPTLLYSVPTFYARLLRADLPQDTFRSLRCAISAGERLPPEIYEAFKNKFGVEILDAIGTTESMDMVLANRPGKVRPGSSGTPIPGTEVRLLDAAGREVADGEEGELHIKSPAIAAGYWNRVERTRQAFLGEWFRTGDVYARDAEGYYFHRGRADDFFKVAGQWVAPAEVEAVLNSHPVVADAGVIGVEADGGLIKPFAFVVAKNPGGDMGALVGELTALVGEKLSSHQRPRRIVVIDELPRTATGKLQRYILRQKAAATLAPGETAR